MFGLGQVQPTAFDLNFEAFGIPVRVHPAFWIMPVAIAAPWVQVFGPSVLFVAILVIFLSILVHELGHALTQRYYGFRSEIVLYWMGGYARFDGRGSRHWWHQVLIIAAGPGAQLLLWLAVWIFERQLTASGRLPDPLSPASAAIEMMLLINFWWALINLVPVYPLDGGQIARQLFVRFRPWDGIRTSLIVSIAAGAVIGYLMIVNDYRFFGILLLFCAFQSYQELQGPRTRW